MPTQVHADSLQCPEAHWNQPATEPAGVQQGQALDLCCFSAALEWTLPPKVSHGQFEVWLRPLPLEEPSTAQGAGAPAPELLETVSPLDQRPTAESTATKAQALGLHGHAETGCKTRQTSLSYLGTASVNAYRLVDVQLPNQSVAVELFVRGINSLGQVEALCDASVVRRTRPNSSACK